LIKAEWLRMNQAAGASSRPCSNLCPIGGYLDFCRLSKHCAAFEKLYDSSARLQAAKGLQEQRQAGLRCIAKVEFIGQAFQLIHWRARTELAASGRSSRVAGYLRQQQLTCGRGVDELKERLSFPTRSEHALQAHR